MCFTFECDPSCGLGEKNGVLDSSSLVMCGMIVRNHDVLVKALQFRLYLCSLLDILFDKYRLIYNATRRKVHTRIGNLLIVFSLAMKMELIC